MGSIDECCYERDEEELEEEPPSVDFDDQNDSNTISISKLQKMCF